MAREVGFSIPYVLRWILGVVATVLVACTTGWAAHISSQVGVLSGKVASLESSISSNDSTRQMLWAEVTKRLDRLDARLDRIEGYVKNSRRGP